MSDNAPGTEPSGQIAGREKGWWRLVVAAALILLLPLTPMRLLLPVDQTIVLLAPALAACALVGWWAGGRLPLALVWVALATWILWQFTAGANTMAFLTGGWAVLLAAIFGSLALTRRLDDGAAGPFFPRAVLAIGVALLLGAIIALAVPGGSHSLLDALRMEMTARSDTAITAWHQTTATPEWTTFTAQHPEVVPLAQQMEEQLRSAPEYAVVLFPAMLALESLAGLALAWAVYHRVGRTRLGPPLSALRDFRFNDQLVWGLVAGLVLVVVPWFSKLSPAGANLLVFFGAIYALRGLGVGLWFLAPGRVVMALLIGFSLFFWHVLGVLALGLGLGDTWLDWRARARQHAERK
jgi:predicted membrane protein DUF2232